MLFFLLDGVSALGGLIPSGIARFAVGAIGALSVLYLIRKAWPVRLLPSKGKTVLVTGCDTPLGFGNVIVRRLLQLGYVVFAGCLDANTARETVYADLRENPSFHAIQLDITNQSQVDKAAEEIGNWLKGNPDFRLFAVVNNAGIGAIAPMEWLRMETFTNIVNVNLFGSVRVTKTFLPLIRGGGYGGRVVVMDSLAGEIHGPLWTPYCASKAALLAVVECLSIEVAQFGIKVSAICPGVFRTNIVTETDKTIATTEKEAALVRKDVFEAYGGEIMVQRLKNAQLDLLKVAKPDFTPVIDCVVDAIASPYPKRRYHPMDFISLLLLKVVFNLAPSAIIDALLVKIMNG